MEYFVTGATGFIGTHVVHALVDDGHDVIALTRSRSNVTRLPDDVTIVEGDITAKETMQEAMAGVDGVFHIAAGAYVGPGPRNVETAERVNIDGTRNVLELMEELGVPRGVYTSTVGIYGDPEGDIIDESYRYDGSLPNVYHRTKWQAHYEVAKPMRDGLPLVTVQPAGVYGPWDKPSGSVRGAFRDYLQGDLPLIPRGFNRPWEYAADTARSHVLAMERGDPGEVFCRMRDGQIAERRVQPDMFGLMQQLGVVEPPGG